jgi:hypothetical protein
LPRLRYQHNHVYGINTTTFMVSTQPRLRLISTTLGHAVVCQLFCMAGTLRDPRQGSVHLGSVRFGSVRFGSFCLVRRSSGRVDGPSQTYEPTMKPRDGTRYHFESASHGTRACNAELIRFRFTRSSHRCWCRRLPIVCLIFISGTIRFS